MTLTTFKKAALAAMIALCAPVAFASVTYVTGADANNDGIDDAWTVNVKDAYLVTKVAKGWPALPNTALTYGKYISWNPDQYGRSSTTYRDNIYDFAINFEWQTSATVNSLVDFRWISDDHLLDVIWNGQSLGVTNSSVKNNVWTIANAQTATAMLLNGTNTVHFMVKNDGGGAVGLATDFTIRADKTPPSKVPEPASLALIGLGLAGLAMRRKKSA